MSEFLTPGAFVRHPARPDWGLGQIQSVTGQRVTVNFEGVGKVLILTDRVALIASEPDSRPSK
jgi:transcription elongation factor GreA-like protein